MFAQLGVTGLILTVLGVWLAVVIAERDTQAAVRDRLTENLGLLDTVGPAIRSGDAEEAARLLRNYEAQTGSAVVVFAADGTPIAASRPDLLPLDAIEQARTSVALSGVASIPDDPVWPWENGPVVIAAPLEDTEQGWSGAFLAVVPSEPVHRAVATDWSLLAGCVVLSLLTVGAVTDAMARWITAPVHRLADAVRALEPGQSLAIGIHRLNGRSATGSGPPELQTLAVALDEVSQRVRTVVSRQSMFVSQASHQLRAPLAALRLRAEALGSVLDEDAHDEHALLIEEIDRLARICDTLLAFARARPVEPTGDIDIAGLVDARLAAWAPMAAARGVTLRRSGVLHAWARAADQLVGQVFDVLIDNATRYAGTGATVEIDIRAVGATEDTDPVEGFVDVHIVDDGPGMSAAELARAATPFATAPSSADGGSGLGLTIASALAESAGGRLKLSRVQPHGVDAWIRLPAGGAGGSGPTRVTGRHRMDGWRGRGAATASRTREQEQLLSQ
jgi:signal transduction histidine kinase